MLTIKKKSKLGSMSITLIIKLLRDKERIRYQSNGEYHDRVRARAKALYRLKTADIPELRRGRKPKPKPVETDGESLPKQKGRPKTKAIVNV